MNQYIANFFKGLGVGSANVIPGVSGGTIALITGIFERLINALKSCNLTAIKLFFTGKFKEFAQHIDLWFLVSVGSGVLVAILSIARLFEFMFAEYPIYLWSFFFGMILVSIYYVGITIDKFNWKVLVSFVIGTAIALLIAFGTPAKENSNFIYLMICGAVATCSMILPGLSGSFVLVLMGNYQLIMIDAVNDLNLKILLPVVVGGVVGLLAFSHLLSWIFKNYRDITIAVLTGFILGSMPIIWPWKNDVITYFGSEAKVTGYEYYLPELNLDFSIALVIMLIGAALIVLTEKMAKKGNNGQ
jgi:putative membrane protein